MSFDLLRDLFSPGGHPAFAYSVISGGIAPDAVLVNVKHGWPNCIELLFYSESFEELKEGELIPLVDIVCKREAPTT